MTVAIISALLEEQAGLSALLVDRKVVATAGRKFHSGLLFGQPVVLALSRIGKVSAATTATVLIERFEASEVIFTGVSGGIHPKAFVGDVIVGSGYLQHDMNCSPLYPQWEIPSYGRAEFPADAALHARAMVAAEAAHAQLALHLLPLSSAPVTRAPVVHSGLIISGDEFIQSEAGRERLLADHPEALAAEMEGAAVAQVCLDYGVAFVAVRLISDRAGANAGIDFSAFIKRHAAPFALEFVRQMLCQPKSG